MAFGEDDNLDNHAGGINNLLDKSEHPFFIWKYLIIFLAADVVLLSVVGFAGYSGMLFADRDSSSNKGEGQAVLYCLLLGFGFGFLIGFFLFRLLRSAVVKSKPVETGLLSGYSNESAQGGKLTIYLFSATTGLLNLGLVLLIYFYFQSKYN